LSRSNEYFEEVSEIASKLDRGSIDKAIGILHDAWKSDNQVFTIGNRGSASLGKLTAPSLQSKVEASPRRSKGL
jgi:phosphoheptose isomerase